MHNTFISIIIGRGERRRREEKGGREGGGRGAK